MPRAYRDDTEMARSRLAELRYELSQHRERGRDAAALQRTVASLSPPSRSRFARGAFVGVACACLTIVLFAYGLITDALVFSFFAIVGIAMLFWVGEHDQHVSMLIDESGEQKQMRLRIAEAKGAREALDSEQQRELENEQRTCVAIEEEITQMERMLEPSARAKRWSG